jgi:hypothetical protein
MISPVPLAMTLGRPRPGRLGYALTLLALIFIAAGFNVLAADPLRYQGGLRNSAGPRQLNAKQLEQLLHSLRAKTGFLELSFNDEGFLALGDATNFSGGSETARALIAAAVKISHVIELECHNRSALIAFARLGQPIIYISMATKRQIEAYPVEIDFNDFNHLRGDKRVLAAFDLGFVVLHELAHAVLGLHDTIEEADSPGQCEEHINRIRRELNLPERQHYVARTFLMAASASYKTTRQAELIFAQAVEQQGRMKLEKLILNWEAERVGPVRNTDFKAQTARAQTAAAP